MTEMKTEMTSVKDGSKRHVRALQATLFNDQIAKDLNREHSLLSQTITAIGRIPRRIWTFGHRCASSHGRSMMTVRALTVIGEDLDNSALVDASVATSFNHQFEFDLQGVQTPDSLFDLDQAGLGNAVCRRAGLMRIVLEYQQRANGINIETQLAGVPDKRETAQVRSRIATLVAFASVWRHKQADAFIIADGWHFDAALTGRVADRDFFHHFSLAPLVARGCRKIASV
jgi:hypothetical protein